jgi:hypothetical protein
MLRAPLRRDRCVGEVLGGLGPLALNMTLARSKIWSEVGEHFAQAGLGKLREVERAKAAMYVVEAVIECVQLAG